MAVQQHRGDGRIHAAGETEDHFIVAYLPRMQRATASSIIFAGVHSASHWQISHKTLQHARIPVAWPHSGELYTVEVAFLRYHNGERQPRCWRRSRSRTESLSLSPWLIHTSSSGLPSASGNFQYREPARSSVSTDLRNQIHAFIRTFYMTAAASPWFGIPYKTPNTGTPASKTYCGCARGLLVCFPPPERIMPLLKSRICASVTSTPTVRCKMPTCTARNQLSVLRTEVQNEDAMLMNASVIDVLIPRQVNR